MFKIAIENQVNIIPIYVYNTHDMYKLLNICKQQRVNFYEKCYKFAGIQPFWGKYGLPLAYHDNTRIIIGKPISPPIIKKNEIKWNDVELFYKSYCDNIQNLYQKYRKINEKQTLTIK
jgi:hypothetical protein